MPRNLNDTVSPWIRLLYISQRSQMYTPSLHYLTSNLYQLTEAGKEEGADVGRGCVSL